MPSVEITARVVEATWAVLLYGRYRGADVSPSPPDTNDTNDTSETNGLRTVEEILAEARESAARREREDAWPDV